MKWFIWSIRSAFCKHDWEREEIEVERRGFETGISYGMWERVSATCKKCGYHRRYWKF